MNLDLKNKRAIVCGSTQGIGKAAALELAAMGASVTLVARNEQTLIAAKAELDNSKGQNHDYLVADFTNTSDLKQKIEAYVNKSGSSHILVNNTGGPAGGPILNAKLEEFTQTFSNHLLCNHLLVQALAEGMKKEGYGRI